MVSAVNCWTLVMVNSSPSTIPVQMNRSTTVRSFSTRSATTSGWVSASRTSAASAASARSRCALVATCRYWVTPPPARPEAGVRGCRSSGRAWWADCTSRGCGAVTRTQPTRASSCRWSFRCALCSAGRAAAAPSGGTGHDGEDDGHQNEENGRQDRSDGHRGLALRASLVAYRGPAELHRVLDLVAALLLAPGRLLRGRFALGRRWLLLGGLLPGRGHRNHPGRGLAVDSIKISSVLLVVTWGDRSGGAATQRRS